MHLRILTLLTCATLAGPTHAQTPTAAKTPAQIQAQAVSPADSAALSDFGARARAYIAAEQALPLSKLKPTSDVAALAKRRIDLRDAVQHSRPNAAQGDFFTPAAAPVFRRLLAQTLAGPDGPKIIASLKHAEPNAPKNLAVNAVYPNTHGQPIQSVPPTLLANLPILPKGLEYTVAGKTLALRDTAANLVADLLPNALP